MTPSRKHRQRGVALLAAILVVALAAVLVAALLDRSETSQARTRNALRAEQGWQLMQGLEGWAATALMRDREQDGIDSNNDIWAQDLPPIELPGVRILGRMRDLDGCFNLNNLTAGGTPQPVWIERFRRLLVALKLDEQIADQAIDWTDPDGQPEGRGGAEDMRLLVQRPPYRAANRPFSHVSELRLLPGVTDEVYRKLASEVCALPPLPLQPPSTEHGSVINLNTASQALWMTVHPDITPGMATQLWREGRARFNSIETIENEVGPLIGIDRFKLPNGFTVSSQWFVLEAEIQSDGIPFLYTSLLQRTQNGTFVVARWRGRY